MDGYIVLRRQEGQRGAERVGSTTEGPLPMPGDLLVLGWPGDSGSGPYEVLSREYVNGDWYVIVRGASLSASVAAEHVQGFG